MQVSNKCNNNKNTLLSISSSYPNSPWILKPLLFAVQDSTNTPRALERCQKGIRHNKLSPSPSTQPPQPARQSTNLRCCLDDARTRRCIDSIRLEVRLTLCSRVAGSRATA